MKGDALHKSITLERVEAAVKDSLFDLANPGFCLACGEDAEGVEPDARHYTCAVCEASEVFGAEEVLVLCFGGFTIE